VKGESGIGLRRGRFILKSIESLDLAGTGRVIYTEPILRSLNPLHLVPERGGES
ncbi:MAG: hypothetical protein HQK60_11465, partial [Deltaproteobacteria bacterium]|nr:hypothetical protein [Deltaproteobacteria bacterium]